MLPVAAANRPLPPDTTNVAVPWTRSAPSMPFYDGIRRDPRFRSLLEKMRLA